ncbi:uncharacterized protein [Amphiura filiformis]|uniref:uncharacterized protein n=1 Tax=Amphiura filiformis TaxID=82378 RepID=UPI003B21D8A0
MEYLSIIFVVILSCLVRQISCAVLSQVDTGAKMTKTIETDHQNVLQDDVVGTLLKQVQEHQMLNDDEIYGINNDQNKDQISASGFYSDTYVNGRTDNGAADKQRNLLHSKQTLHKSQGRRKDSISKHSLHMQHLIVNTAEVDDSTPTHRDNNHFREETATEKNIENDAYEIVPSTDKMYFPTSVEELDGVIIGSIIGGFVAIWATVVVTIICCSFCNYHPHHRERLSDVYRDYGMEDNWFTMSDYSGYKREYQRI